MTTDDDLVIEWTTRMSVFRNRVVITQLLFVFTIPILLLGLIILILADPADRWWAALQVMGVTAAILGAMLLITVIIFTLVGYNQRFRLDKHGVQSALSGRALLMMKIARILLLFSRRPSAMGAALLTRFSDTIRWQEVWQVTVYETLRQMILYRKRGAPFLLECTPDNFATVREIVLARTEPLARSVE
ncbi:hypothetical protein [Chloroflexus sp.]|uniref:hypothetical protein n=1 Tax=Chloroflexus sp. TaxID=1904827 RepID=UPI0026079B3C|nr:hypothetical protein [uncultured Chloroflexus sp.]